MRWVFRNKATAPKPLAQSKGGVIRRMIRAGFDSASTNEGKGKKAIANGREFTGPVHIARQSMLGEVSFVALGADDHTSASVAASRSKQAKSNPAHIVKEDDMKFNEWLEAKGFDPDALTETQTTNLEAMFEAEVKAEQAQPTGTEADGGGGPVGGVGGDTDVIARIRAETAAETTRISAVRRICAGKHDEIEANAIRDGWDTNQTELEVLRAQRPSLNHGGVRRDADPSQSGRSIEAALCLSAGLPEKQVGAWYDEKTMNAALAHDLQGAGLHTLIYETIHAAGGFERRQSSASGYSIRCGRRRPRVWPRFHWTTS